MQVFVISQSVHFKQRVDKNYSLFQTNQNNTFLCKDRLPSLNKVIYFKPQSDMIYGTGIFYENMV